MSRNEEPAYLQQLRFAFRTGLGTVDRDLGGVVEYSNNHVTLVADKFPLGDTGRVEDQDSLLTLNTVAHPKPVDAEGAGWVGAGRAGRPLHHLTERRIAVTVGAEDKGFPLGPGSEVDKLKVVQRTLELLVELECAVLLGHVVGFVAGRAEEPFGLGLHQLHVASTLAAPGKRAAALGQRREGHLKQLVHALHVLDKIQKLALEHLERVGQHRLEVRLAQSDEVKLLFDGRAHGRLD